ncbi:class I SAM-dependent methyltransferase [Candidatus Gottesmanbacteria bacterium]|nr:class I SAM-dependent methyltransferase [Candidatus Gottesmanbacteria bacterium]
MKSIVTKHFDNIASQYDYYKKKNSFYYSSLKLLLHGLIPPDKNILEIGCGTGDILSFLKPKLGVGIDISSKMIDIARKKYPMENLHFVTSPIDSYKTQLQFDYILMADVVEHLTDIDKSFKFISKLTTHDTIFINTMINPIWEPLLAAAEKLNMKMPEGPHKRISFEYLKEIASIHGLKIITHSYFLLCPIEIPFVTRILNSIIEPYLRKFTFIEYFTATRSLSSSKKRSNLPKEARLHS